MAISWDVKISSISLASNRATVTATRTDSESALSPQVYSFQNVPLGTPADRVAILNTIKAKCVEKAAEYAALTDFIDDLEQSGKSQLEAWELTR